MYTFVFMWTPALQRGPDDALPFGVIFAAFMVCVMIGSAVFSVAIQRASPERVCLYTLAVAAGSLAVPLLTLNSTAVLLAFLLFEVCCGMWWPSIGTLRGMHIPEATRAGVMNLFRVPLNFLVCAVLLQVGQLSTPVVFLACTVWLLLAVVLQIAFTRMPANDAALLIVAGEKTKQSDPEISAGP